MQVDPFENPINLIDLLNYVAPITQSCLDAIIGLKSLLKSGRKEVQKLLNDIELSVHGLSKEELLRYINTDVGDGLYNRLRVEIKKQIEIFDTLYDYVEQSTDVLCSQGIESIPVEISSIYLKGNSWLNEVIKKVYEIVPNGISRNTLLISAGLMSPFSPPYTNITAAWAWDYMLGEELYDKRAKTYPDIVNPTPMEEDLGLFLSMRIDDTPQQIILHVEKDLRDAEYRKTQWSFGLEDPSLSMAIALTIKDTEQEALDVIEQAKQRINEYDGLLDLMRKRVQELRDDILPGGGGKSKRRKTKRRKTNRRKTNLRKSNLRKSNRKKSNRKKSNKSKK